MKRLICLALAALLCLVPFCAAEDAPDPDIVAYEALDIIAALMMCPSAVSFEDAPPEELAQEAVFAYKIIGEIEEISDREIYALMFAFGEYLPPAEAIDPALVPVQIEIDSAIDAGDGTVKASVTVYADTDDGYDFYCLADVYLLPDETAPCGSRICGLFFPE